MFAPSCLRAADFFVEGFADFVRLKSAPGTDK
jgi:hypothetical protein